MIESPLKKGDIVKTSYESGPYVIENIMGPTEKPSYVDNLNGKKTPSKPHFCYGCRLVTDKKYKSSYFLNGYALDIDGVIRNVWADGDTLHIVGHEKGRQGELF